MVQWAVDKKYIDFSDIEAQLGYVHALRDADEAAAQTFENLFSLQLKAAGK